LVYYPQQAGRYLLFISIGMAQLKVCFVDTLAEAGWQTQSQYKGRFG
jgi:hypothetical protein